MDQDDEDLFLMQQLAPGNIVGVHNYCDSWCDRCGFANRCVINMSRLAPPKRVREGGPALPEREGVRAPLERVREGGPREKDQPGDEPPEGDPLLDHLKTRFDQVRTLVARRSTFSVDELLKSLPEPDAGDEAEYDRAQARREQRRKHDPILREAQAYLQLARAWFEAETEGMRVHADALVRRAEVENVDDISLSELSRILDAVEIVRRDCFLIFVKLHRAIDGFEEDRDARWSDPIQNDYNGSAKLALTCIDRSEGAWRAIDQWYPSCGGARALADQLAALRAAVEQRLPRARAFLRPGFDGLVTPD